LRDELVHEAEEKDAAVERLRKDLREHKEKTRKSFIPIEEYKVTTSLPSPTIQRSLMNHILSCRTNLTRLQKSSTLYARKILSLKSKLTREKSLIIDRMTVTLQKLTPKDSKKSRLKLKKIKLRWKKFIKTMKIYKFNIIS
jgi:hypothetical protein